MVVIDAPVLVTTTLPAVPPDPPLPPMLTAAFAAVSPPELPVT